MKYRHLLNERDPLVVPYLLRALHVGKRDGVSTHELLKVAAFLKEHFPGLQYLYRPPGYYEGTGL